MSKNKKGYSIIEGCIRQSLDLPIKKHNKDLRVYSDDNIYLSSSHKSDHEYMDRREKDKYKNQKMPWEKRDD
tara:strand:+ start:335 stop:550 length:216 start_codon:yes stop_codon:yes gene_type:complete